MKENNSANDSAKMQQEFYTEAPKWKWQILDWERAKEGKIQVIDVNNTPLLEIKLSDIPKHMSVVVWLTILINTGIILKQ
jgi:hypothetical protein